jgi:hypothetical protein
MHTFDRLVGVKVHQQSNKFLIRSNCQVPETELGGPAGATPPHARKKFLGPLQLHSATETQPDQKNKKKQLKRSSYARKILPCRLFGTRNSYIEVSITTL